LFFFHATLVWALCDMDSHVGDNWVGPDGGQTLSDVAFSESYITLHHQC